MDFNTLPDIITSHAHVNFGPHHYKSIKNKRGKDKKDWN